MSLLLPEPTSEAEALRAYIDSFYEDVLRFVRPTIPGTRLLLVPARVRFGDRTIVGRDRVLVASYCMGVRAALRAAPATAATTRPSGRLAVPTAGNRRRRRRGRR